MKILNLYLIGSFLRALLLILLILLLLFSFIELLKELDEIGTGSYHLADAINYIIATMPGRLYDLLPVGTMLAGIIGLGLLADHNELLAMQASGRTPQQIRRPILLTGMVLMVLAAGVAEYIVPPLEMNARTQRLTALAETGILVTDQDLWLRYQEQLIRIGRDTLCATTTNIDIYRRRPNGDLLSFIHSPKAWIVGHSRWRLEDVEEKIFSPSGDITPHQRPALTLALALDKYQMTLLRLPPESLSPPRLISYIKELTQRGQNAEHYRMVLWQKLSLPFAMLAMLAFSLALIFGPTRSLGGGKRMTIAILIAISLYFCNQIIANLGLLFNLHPALVTILPIGMILALSLGLRFRERL
jgi:lipopolysaccharide export system permease protein